MKIGDVLKPSCVVVGLRANDKAALLRELARRSAVELSLDQQTILAALQAREDLGSTGIGRGIAIPHARLTALHEPFVMFVRLAGPIDFAAVDERPVDLVMMLLSPLAVGNQHVAMLAAIVRPLRDEAIVRRLREAPDGPLLHRELAGL